MQRKEPFASDWLTRPLSFLALPVDLLGNEGVKGNKRTLRVKLIGQEVQMPKSFPVRFLPAVIILPVYIWDGSECSRMN